MAGGKNGLKVVGAVAVLKLVSGGERYLYEGAVLPTAGFTEESVKHHVGVGLVELVDIVADAGGSAGPYDGVNNADLKAEVAKRNDGREESAKIAPDSQKNVSLIAALVADDEKTKAAASSGS